MKKKETYLLKRFIKFVFLVMFVPVFLFSACSNDADKNKKKENISCDSIINQYNSWITQYSNLIDSIEKNLENKHLKKQIIEITSQNKKWNEHWLSFEECLKKEDIKQKYDSITTKLKNAIKKGQSVDTLKLNLVN